MNDEKNEFQLTKRRGLIRPGIQFETIKKFEEIWIASLRFA